MIAALGMYDRPETAAAHDALWSLMREALRDMGQGAPDCLSRGDLAYWDGWLSSDLLFSQTCSLPFRVKLSGRVNIIATPDYGLECCPAGHYRSVYIARKDDQVDRLEDTAGRDFAYNEALSHSGWAAPYADHMARGMALVPTLRTGAHRGSAQAVAEGRADYAAIDALTWKLICTYDSFANKLKVIGHTPVSPALPYITTQNPAPLRDALAQAIAALSSANREVLHLHGLVDIAPADYLALPIPPNPPCAYLPA